MTHRCARCQVGRELAELPRKKALGLCYSCAPRTHGHTVGRVRTRTYRAWDNMIQRCTNKKRWDWELYGGRGIVVTPLWRGRGGFARFLLDMGEAPADLELDRTNNDGPYMKSNCRWVTRGEQVFNRRNLAKWKRAS